MKNLDLIKVAGFISSLKESLSKDNPERGRMIHAGLGGAAGVGLGGWMGYNNALNEAMEKPFHNIDVWGDIGAKPGVLKQLFADAPDTIPGKLSEMARSHGKMLPSFAKLRTSKLAIPALLAGGAGAALGSLIPGKTRTPRDRMEKLWSRRPDLLR